MANITLVGYNSKYSNRSFTDKKHIENGFSDSPLHLNQWIAKQDKWNEETLKNRNRWLLEQIEKIWPRPEHQQ